MHILKMCDTHVRLRVIALFLTITVTCVHAQPIQRLATAVRAFRDENPCPSTGKTHGACPGWQVDHPDPLCRGGKDHKDNMQWITVEDHKWKTFVDVRECRKFRKMANTPAQERPKEKVNLDGEAINR